MRFKNLTITLTLMCLSIVALAGLVLLPITNGICDWTGGASSKSYSESQLDDDEQGWNLSASLNASASYASGSVSPSIHTAGVFTSETTYSGYANLRAWRSSGQKWDIVYCSYGNGCENYHNCPGHQQAVAFESAEDPESKVIYTTVDMVTVVHVWGEERHWITKKGTGVKAETTVGIDEFSSVTVGGETYTWEENGVKYYAYRSESRTNPDSGPSDGASAQVKNYPSANCGAEVTFNFEHPIGGQGDISTTNSVSYTGVPLQGSN